MSIYKEVILDHYHHPHNHGTLDNPDTHVEVINSVCGDKIRIMLKIVKGKVADVRFEGNGCAISIASTSLLTDHIKGMSLKKIANLTQDDITRLLTIPLSPNRLKCALLPLEALHEAIALLKD